MHSVKKENTKTQKIAQTDSTPPQATSITESQTESYQNEPEYALQGNEMNPALFVPSAIQKQKILYAPALQTDTIPTKKNKKKPLPDDEKTEKKKTSTLAKTSFILSVLSIFSIVLNVLFVIGSPFVSALYPAVQSDYMLTFMFVVSSTLSLFSGYCAWLAYSNNIKENDKWKNVGFLLPGFFLGTISLMLQASFAYMVLLWLLINQDAFIFVLLIPIILLALVEFIRKYIKKRERKKEFEHLLPPISDKVKTKIKRRKLWAYLMLGLSIPIMLILLLFPEAFIGFIAFNMDYYLFLFACLLFLCGVFVLFRAFHLKEQYKQ